MIRYLYGIATAVSVMANALIGGQPTETLSCRAARARRDERRWGCVLCKFLDTIDPGHCDDALAWWEGSV